MKFDSNRRKIDVIIDEVAVPKKMIDQPMLNQSKMISTTESEMTSKEFEMVNNHHNNKCNPPVDNFLGRSFFDEGGKLMKFPDETLFDNAQLQILEDTLAQQAQSIEGQSSNYVLGSGHLPLDNWASPEYTMSIFPDESSQMGFIAMPDMEENKVESDVVSVEVDEIGDSENILDDPFSPNSVDGVNETSFADLIKYVLVAEAENEGFLDDESTSEKTLCDDNKQGYGGVQEDVSEKLIHQNIPTLPFTPSKTCDSDTVSPIFTSPLIHEPDGDDGDDDDDDDYSVGSSDELCRWIEMEPQNEDDKISHLLINGVGSSVFSPPDTDSESEEDLFVPTKKMKLQHSYNELATDTQLTPNTSISMNNYAHFSHEKNTDAPPLSCDQDTDVVLVRDGDGDLPLHIAVAQENMEAVDVCLELMEGMNLDVVNFNHHTPLHLACAVGNVSIISALVDKGASPHAVDRDGNTVMHFACKTGSLDILQVLESYYAERPKEELDDILKGYNHEGMTPLHEAVNKRHHSCDETTKHSIMRVINFLVQNFDCNLDLQELKRGRSVLIMAMEMADWELVDLLLTCGADVNVGSYRGWTPLDYVARTHNLDLAKNLITRGAQSGGGSKTEFSINAMKVLFDNDKRKRRRHGAKRP